jgi:hypothetical protein
VFDLSVSQWPTSAFSCSNAATPLPPANACVAPNIAITNVPAINILVFMVSLLRSGKSISELFA